MAQEQSSQTETITDEKSAPAATPQEIHSWLNAIKSSAILPLLHESAFLLIGVSAFTGFRMNAQGYANPLVRRRLAAEAAKNSKFAEKLRGLAAKIPATSSPSAKPLQGASESAPKAPPAAPNLPDLLEEKTRKERERRRERDQARKELAETKAALAQALEETKRVAAENAQMRRELERTGQRLARRERQISKLQQEQALLLQAQPAKGAPEKSVAKRPAPAASPSQSLPNSTVSIWQTAVHNLLDRGKYEEVIKVTEDVLRMQPYDRTALKMEAQALAGLGQRAQAGMRYRELITASFEQGVPADAIDGLLHYLLLPPTVAEARKTAREFLTKLRPDAPETHTQMQVALARLKASQPSIHQWLQAQIQAADSAALKELLKPAAPTLKADDFLPLRHPDLPRPITAQLLIEAIDGGQEQIVDPARAALRDLRRTNTPLWNKIKTILMQAAEGDQSYIAMLRQQPRGPIIVDGSNVAWSGQDLLVHGRPRLRPLLELRRSLRSRGYFPIVLIGDAPLPHTIDDAAVLSKMQSHNEIQIVNAGEDADEYLVREAKRKHAPLVTNDYMADWDPNDEVRKIPYTVSLDGAVQLLADLDAAADL